MKKIFGLIGFPLSHSFSKNYFNDKFFQEGSADLYSYENFELNNLSGFVELLNSNPTLFGLNVTIPYKEKIIPYLNELTDYALPVGAVNTILINRATNGIVTHTTGYNTDVTGFLSTIQPMLKMHHTGALVLGTGGASKAIIHALKLLNIPCLTVSRQKSDFTINYMEITKEMLQLYPVVINTTPLGTFPESTSCPPVPFDFLTPINLLYDLVYNPSETVFLLKGRMQGAETSNGYGMLVAQANAAWKLWMTSHERT